MENVSVIITTYKRTTEVVRRAIESVLSQTYGDWGLYVINDYPEDIELVNSIKELIDSYNDSRINYFLHKENMGACQARNTGIEKSFGSYIAFLDDDDEWCSTKLEKMLPFFSSSSIGMVYCDAYLVKGSLKLHKNIPKFSKYKDDVFNSLLLSNFIGSTSFPIMTRKALVDSGMFDINLRACQDLDMWLRITQRFNAVYCEEPLVKYHFSNECITGNIEARIEGHQRIIDKFQHYYFNNSELYALKLLSIANDCLMTGDIGYFNKYLYQALKINIKSALYLHLVIKSFLIYIRNTLIK